MLFYNLPWGYPLCVFIICSVICGSEVYYKYRYVIFLYSKATSDTDYEPLELTNEHLQRLTLALREGKASSNHIRVNVVGNQGVGKTTLVKRLQREIKSCKDQVTEPTEALDIKRVTLRCVQSATSEDKEWQTDLTGKTQFSFIKRVCIFT